MNLVRKIASAFAPGSKSIGSDITTTEELFAMISGAGYARSGAFVSWSNALCITAVLGCVRVVSEDIAKVDFELIRADGRSQVPAVDHPLYELLAYQPNGWQTSFEFREILTAFAMLTGNGIAYITRGVDDTPLELIPLPQPWVSVRRAPNSWDLIYTVSFPNGGGKIQTTSKNIFHLRGPSFDGFTGMDMVRTVREALGLAMAGEEHQARLAEGSLQTAGYLTSPNPLTKDQVDQIKEYLKQNKGGIRNAGMTPLFQNGIEYKELGSTGQKAEILETRKFQVEEICRAFRVFPQMVGYTDKTSTHGSASEFFSAHVSHTLMPWSVRWEQTVRRDLLSVKDRVAGLRAKLMLQNLLRGDPASRGAFYKDLAQCGAITPNEIRIDEGKNPLPGLDIPLRPVNMTPETETTDAAKKPKPGAPDNEPDPEDTGEDDESEQE